MRKNFANFCQKNLGPLLKTTFYLISGSSWIRTSFFETINQNRVSFWIFSKVYLNSWRKFSEGLTNIILSVQKYFFLQTNCHQKKWDLTVFGLWTKTAGFLRKSLAALSKLQLTCPSKVYEKTVLFPRFLFKYCRTLRVKKSDLSAKKIRKVSRKLHFTWTEEYLGKLFPFHDCFWIF